MPSRWFIWLFCASILLVPSTRLIAATADSSRPDGIFRLDDDGDDNPSRPAGRYFFNLLDGRSSYGTDFFHDPLIGPELDAESQVELDYAHSEGHGHREDEFDAGAQWNPVGQLTLAAEVGWDSEHHAPGAASDPEDGTADSEEAGDQSGWENIDLAVYHPLLQLLNADKTLDYTLVGRLDVGIPTRTQVSGTDVQFTPLLGQLLRIGQHISAEAWTGVEFTFVSHDDRPLIYGASIGYVIDHGQLRLPATRSVTPIIELDGQAPLAGDGQDALFGVVGVNVTFKSAGWLAPRFQIGYQFPLDQGARDELSWGIVSELQFDF